MNQFETDLARSLNALADDMEPEGSQRVVEEVHAARTSGLRRKVVALGAGFAAAAVAVGLLSATEVVGGTDPESSASGREGAAVGPGVDSITLDTEPGEPCPFAQRGSVQEVADRADVPIWIPVGAKLTGAWTCGADAPVLTFGAIRVFYEPGWSDVDVDEKWADLIKDYGGHLDTVLDRPALVQPVTEDSTSPQVMVVSGDVLIRLLGDKSVPPEAMVALANSIDIEEPVRP